MIINEVAIGNAKSAYIEKRFSPNVNVLYSNDNNKGKTILIQSISYALGASDVFPDGININDYHVYVSCSINNKIIEIVRKRRDFFVLVNNELNIFDSVSEFKYFYNKNIMELPKYFKDGKEKVVDFPLYYELSFIPQDGRDPSNIINKTGTNKVDFLDMLASMMNNGYKSDLDLSEIEEELKSKKKEKSALSRKIKCSSDNKEMFSELSITYDREKYELITTRLSELESYMSELIRKRTLETNRKIKLVSLTSELISLNRKLNEGYFICADCGSEKVLYKKNDTVFDTSNPDVRANILNAITLQIKMKEEQIEKLNIEINKAIEEKQKELKDIPEGANDYFLYLREYKNVEKNLIELDKTEKEIELLIKKKKAMIELSESSKENYKKMIRNILMEMNRLQSLIEVNTSTIYKDIFTTKTKIFSGSTENEYYFCRTVALSNILKHDLPIIIDSFRDGEISSTKEMEMLNIFKKMGKQIIISSTLKDEEYEGESKYALIDGINTLDYEVVKKYNLLGHQYVEEFRKILSKFHILLK
ncbi:MAG: hypothetical protein RR342_03250 [Bacilli bacterium]